jgi:hypothetical protein
MVMKKTPQKQLRVQPCASCPFLPMNHKEFGAVAERLCAKLGQPKPDFWACVSIRENVKNEGIQNRSLQCHSTVYDSKMNPHPEASRPCAGLAAYLRAESAAIGNRQSAIGNSP